MAVGIGVLQNVKFVWRGDKVVANATAEVARRLAMAGEMVVNQMKVNVNTSSDKGLNPSLPGEFPHAGFGQLRNSLFWDFSQQIKAAIDVGSSVMHGLWLEKGVPGGKIIRPKNASVLSWIGRDGVRRFARQITQGRIAPRPFVSTTIEQMAGQLRALFSRKMSV